MLGDAAVAQQAMLYKETDSRIWTAGKRLVDVFMTATLHVSAQVVGHCSVYQVVQNCQMYYCQQTSGDVSLLDNLTADILAGSDPSHQQSNAQGHLDV